MINIKNVEATNLIAVEVAYLGSFIKDSDHPRNMDYYTQRLSIFNPDEFTDPFSKLVAKSISEIYLTNEYPTTKNLTAALMDKKEVQSEVSGILGEIEKAEAVSKLIEYYSSRGAVTPKEFRQRERIMDEARRARCLSDEAMAKKISEINRNFPTAMERALEIKKYIDGVIGGSEFVIKTTDYEAQKQILSNLPDQFKEMVGKPRFTFPAHWQLDKFIPVLRPGEKCVLSGGTGDGKSAMAMQFAEWACICGKNVLVIHMEDSAETILMRQTLRWIGGSLGELERGDPDGKMNKMIALREEWAKNGGSIIYKYLAGNSIDLIVEQIKDVALTLEAQGKQLNVVVMDYFQKADFDSGVKNGQNYVNVATAGAENLKITAERLKLFMFVVSQETPGENGTKHTAWARALEQKPQIYISLTRQEIKKTEDEEYVTLFDKEKNSSQRYPLAKVGDRSVWVQLQIKKVNQGRQGMRYLFFDGPRFRAYDPKWMRKVLDKQESEFNVPVLKPYEGEYKEAMKTQAQAYILGGSQLLDPDEKRRQQLLEREERDRD